ncbi:hypothetical protein RYX36_029686 [Vicia faba]
MKSRKKTRRKGKSLSPKSHWKRASALHDAAPGQPDVSSVQIALSTSHQPQISASTDRPLYFCSELSRFLLLFKFAVKERMELGKGMVRKE